MNSDRFVKDLCSVKFPNVFNPYFDRCERYDYYDAPAKRRTLLKGMLSAASNIEVDSIWIGRDLGYRGGRRTGLALTDDVNLSNHLNRWGLENDRITKGVAVPERTAAVIWSVLSQVSSPVFLWNVFPLHPHEPGNYFSNRAHNAKEREVGIELLSSLVQLLKPKRIVAIGNDADNAVKKLSHACEVYKVRHPSYGGQNIFLDQIRSVYKLNSSRLFE
ncbi:uracil-DNA glycosylase [Microbulbifer elongatus]|uniref:uracil-DNA glycosylase n=1 Tax=Microbulbifer elongatus TaxID=86173 RepID=UPI001E367EB3|nr:uracil-DNA glycosylase [Microbulbifer elongatus]